MPLDQAKQRPVLKRQQEEKKPSEFVSGKEISMTDLLKAQKIIDENSKKAGVSKEPMSRPRSKQTLPLANK